MSGRKKGKVETRIVLDTNILISYLWGSSHCLRIVCAMLLENRFTPAVTPEMMQEFDDVIARPNIKRQIGEIQPAIFRREYLLFAYHVQSGKTIKLCEDPDDNIMLECALASNADYIVTGDPHLLKLERFGKTLIVKPVDFINIYLE